MDSEAESEENEEEEESGESDSGVASLALATAFVSKSIFNSEEKDLPTLLMTVMRTTPRPIASWQKAQRYSNIPSLNLVRMNLMKTSNPAILNLLRLF